MFLTNPLRHFTRPDSSHFFSIINSPFFRALTKTLASPPTSETSCKVRGKGRLISSLSGLEMETSSTCSLVLSGKTATENETALLLKRNDTLKLPDDTEILVLLHSERDKSLEKSGFQIDSDMNALSTDSGISGSSNLKRDESLEESGFQVDSDMKALSTDTEVSVSSNSKRDDSLEESAFQIGLYMNALSTDTFGRFLIWCPRIPSTQDVISHNFSNLPLGAVCVADVQFKGRGRSKNLWESPPGCLMFSFTIQMEDGRVVPLLQYVISLAITEAVKDICDKEGLPYIDLKIKWPNDLYVNGLKVGGILCTSTYRSKKFNVTAGIGLNVDNDKPTTSLNEALANLSSTPYKFRREDILAFFFNKFERLYDIFINQGFQALEELYYQTWLHRYDFVYICVCSGQRVIVQEKKEDQVVENVVTIQGLTTSGYLLAIGNDNQMCELHPDGNSLDFFKGLIKRKL